MTHSSAGAVISQFVSKKQNNKVFPEDEQRPFLSNEDDEPPSDSNSLDKKFLNIEGMTCGACSAMIQKLLTSIDGVESCSVSLLLKRAEVILDSNEINLDDIIEEIEDIGFNASELLISTNNKNNFTIQLFYSIHTDNKQQILDTLMTIEGISNVSCTEPPIQFNDLTSIDMSSTMLTPFPSDFSMAMHANISNINGNDGASNTTFNIPIHNKYILYLTITYDPNITGMRTITEWIHKHKYTCKIIFDASDISQRKRNIQQSREREMLQWTRLFKYSLLFAIPAFLATMIFPFFDGFSDIFNLEFIAGCSIHDVILFLLSTPIQFGPPGLLFYRGAYKSLRAGAANMDVLVALATSISYFFSIIQVIICIIELDASPNTTFETSAVLITVIILGKYMETIAKGKTSQALDKLMDLAPSVARLVENFDENECKSDVTAVAAPRILKIREIDARLIQLNDILEVTRGSKCPCDGIIISGISSMDESLITGESMSVHKCVGDEVIGATVNLSNTIYIRVNKIGNETVLSKIITLVENAQSSRAPIQNLADIIASRFVPCVILISFIVSLGWYIGFETGSIHPDNLFGLNSREHGNHSSIYYSFLFGISVLVISCPCALGLATPTAVMVATGKAAELGILFKGGEPLEIVGQTNCILFDKTGTLTQGKMQIVNVIKISDGSLYKIFKMDECDDIGARDMFWNYVYGAEKQSEHLIGTAVCNFIEGIYNESSDGMKGEEAYENYEHSVSETWNNLRDLNLGSEFKCNYWSPDEFIPHSGLGVTAVYKDVTVLIGNLKYMNKYGVKYKKFAGWLCDEDYDDEVEEKYEDGYFEIVKEKATQLELNGNTCVFIGINKELCGILAIADKIKADAYNVINYLQNKENIACYMITGDNEVTAHAIGKKIGIPMDNIRANVSPQNKQNIVKQLQNTRNIDIIDILKEKKYDYNKYNLKGQVVTFVGDGINDSPSLAQSDVGIAIGAGTDVAIAAASVVLINSKLIDVLNTIDISKATVKRIRINFAWALIYNVCMIPFAAGILYPLIHYALPPFMAGLLMCLSSISVVCNSLLLKLYKPPQNITTRKNNITDSLVDGIRSFSRHGYNSYDNSRSLSK